MKIREALKKTGKAEIVNDYREIHYVALDDDAGKEMLTWFMKENNDALGCVSFEFILRNNWQPYHPQPTECGCQWCEMKEHATNADTKEEYAIASLMLNLNYLHECEATK